MTRGYTRRPLYWVLGLLVDQFGHNLVNVCPSNGDRPLISGAMSCQMTKANAFTQRTNHLYHSLVMDYEFTILSICPTPNCFLNRVYSFCHNSLFYVLNAFNACPLDFFPNISFDNNWGRPVLTARLCPLCALLLVKLVDDRRPRNRSHIIPPEDIIYCLNVIFVQQKTRNNK